MRGRRVAVNWLQWSYVAMLAFCLVGTVPLAYVFGLTVFRQVRRLSLTVLLAGTPYLVWDLWATHVGHWWFSASQTLPPRVFGLPLEEIAFFVVIPLVSILTYEGVTAARSGVRWRVPGRRSREEVAR